MADHIDVAAIRAANPLTETIERELSQHGRRKGAWLMYHCPLHSDEDRSFGINPDGDRWKCFAGCGSGDVIDFIAALRHTDFLGAVKVLGGGVDPATQAIWITKREDEKQAERARQSDARRELLASSRWRIFHDQMGPAQRAWWETQGISHKWQDVWCLGWTPKLWHYGEAYSIPFLDSQHVPATLQYRLAHPPNEKDKYRFEPDLGPAAFIARPDLSLQRVLVVEGAKKAMVTHVLGTREKMQVVGFPSKSSDGGICARLRAEAEQVWIMLDPDAWERPEHASADWQPTPVKFGREIGSQTRLISFPGKIDDALRRGSLDPDGLRRLLIGARAITSYA